MRKEVSNNSVGKQVLEREVTIWLTERQQAWIKCRWPSGWDLVTDHRWEIRLETAGMFPRFSALSYTEMGKEGGSSRVIL